MVRLHSSAPGSGSLRNPWCMAAASSFRRASELGEKIKTKRSPSLACHGSTQNYPLSVFDLSHIINFKNINEDANDKIRKYHADYNNNPPNAVTFMPAIAGTNGRLHSEFIRLLFLQTHRETDRFFAASGVQLSQSTSGGFFHFRRAAFSSMLKSRVGHILAKAAALRINLNLDGAPITSQSHTHPSHSQTSRLLTSSLSLGVPVPRPTQCIRDV